MNGFQIGDFLVVPDRNIVAGPGGSESHLEPKVMQVLCALARRPGEVVSRQALMDECWGIEFGADEGVTRAISKLRKELRDSSAAPHIIETIPKRGYRLALPVEPSDSATTRRTTAAAAVPVAGKSSPRRRTITFALAFSAAIVAVGFWLRDDEAILAPNPPVIAVLPFDAAGEDEAGRAFAWNFSSDLHYGMSRSGPGVKLIGWSSSSYFDEGRKRLKDIRTELDVTHLLSGSLARAGDRIDISVELIDAVEPMEARTALQDLESAIGAFERTAPATDSRKGAVRLMRDRFSELSEVVAALEEGDADSRRALATTLFERASDPAGESGADYAYLVDLPAISLLDGVDRAFEAWDRRLDLLPPYDADYPTNDHRSDVFSFQDNGYLPGFRLLHRDPRFWSLVARYDPRVFVVPTRPHAPPRLQNVVDPIWDELWPPDFCRARNFRYDCNAVASAAFAEASRAAHVVHQ